MKKLNKNNRFNRFKVFAFAVAKLALFLVVAFAVENLVAHLFGALDLAFLEFTLSELGGDLAIKVLMKLLLVVNHFFSKKEKSK